jgi:hypothetical protein
MKHLSSRNGAKKGHPEVGRNIDTHIQIVVILILHAQYRHPSRLVVPAHVGTEGVEIPRDQVRQVVAPVTRRGVLLLHRPLLLAVPPLTHTPPHRRDDDGRVVQSVRAAVGANPVRGRLPERAQDRPRQRRRSAAAAAAAAAPPPRLPNDGSVQHDERGRRTPPVVGDAAREERTVVAMDRRRRSIIVDRRRRLDVERAGHRYRAGRRAGIARGRVIVPIERCDGMILRIGEDNRTDDEC